ncbi:hypothetical protein SLEP1_g58352 [Rubroshorea leprosula]|uniref:Secreted protein n=1 Tax=Rubroshorea leprosula TaxID=152421 RepID=A0AAV5MSB2_9ROSI|nr:hypothetical protein SLEP1_g58352 [Rubroshorea leprosula]
MGLARIVVCFLQETSNKLVPLIRWLLAYCAATLHFVLHHHLTKSNQQWLVLSSHCFCVSCSVNLLLAFLPSCQHSQCQADAVFPGTNVNLVFRIGTTKPPWQ